MPWLSLRVEVERSKADALSDALLEAGAQSVSIDAPDAPRPALVALFASDARPEDALFTACTATGIPVALPTVTHLEDEDWVRKSQAQFTPVRVGRLWVGASWHEAPSDAPARVRIDPGLAFGTGSHPSTRLVLSFLERTVQGGERVLDYGCGSGILAIAAAKLGAARVEGVDVDRQSVEVTLANAQANGVEMQACMPGALQSGRYDLVVANILAQPLIELAPELCARTRSGGRLALAGVLDLQAEEVRAAYAPNFDMGVHEREGDWVLLEGLRR